MTGEKEKQHKEGEEEEEQRQFNQRDTLVGAIHILSNLKEDGELTTWEMSAIELSLQLLMRELDWMDSKIIKPEGLDDEEEEEEAPVIAPERLKTGVEGVVKGMEVYGYA